MDKVTTGNTELDTLMERIGKAVTSGDIGTVAQLSKELLNKRSDIAKAEADRLKLENEKLAIVRQRAATEIHKLLVSAKGSKLTHTDVVASINKLLADTKSTGFTFKLDEPNMVYQSVSLTIPQATTY